MSSEIENLSTSLSERILSSGIIKTFVDPQTGAYADIHCYDGRRYASCWKSIANHIAMAISESFPELSWFSALLVTADIANHIAEATKTPLPQEPMRIAFINDVVLNWECLLKRGDMLNCVEAPDPEKVVFHLIPHELWLDLLREYMRTHSQFNPMEFLDTHAPTIARTLRDWVGDKALLLVEAVGYVLYPRYDLHKAFLLLGRDARGRSMYLELLKTIVGDENVIDLRMSELTKARSYLQDLLHRKLLCEVEMPPADYKRIKNLDIFKPLVGEGTITIQRKYLPPLKFVNYAKLFCERDTIPKVIAESNELRRYWIIVEFSQTKSPFFDDLREELEPLIIAGIMAFAEALRRGRFSYDGN